MSENNQQVRYGAVISIPVSEIPPQTTGKYLGLFQDLSLRLENTPPTEALRVPFDDPKVLAGAHSALKKMFKGQPVAVIKRAGALFVYNEVAPARHTSGPRGPRGPRKIGLSDEQPNGNGRRLEGFPSAVDAFGREEEAGTD